MNKKLIVAHRGHHKNCPENTLESFEAAVGAGADRIELDTRKTKDGLFVVHHDADISGRPLKELTFAELSEIAKGQNFEVPTLEDVLKKNSQKIRFDIELKEEGYEKEIVSLVKKYLATGDFFVSSFSETILRKIKELDPKIKTGLLLGKENPKNLLRTRLAELFPGKRLADSKADFLIPHWKIFKYGFFSKRRMDLPIIVWGVDFKKDIREVLLEEQVQEIITDEVELAIEIRKNLEL